MEAPKTEAKNLVPTVVAATSPLAYVRLHGRNAGTWNARGGSASDRFDYLYSDEELEEWVEPLKSSGRTPMRSTSSSTTTAGAARRRESSLRRRRRTQPLCSESWTSPGFHLPRSWVTVQVRGKIGRWDKGGEPSRHTCALDRRAQRGHHAAGAGAHGAARRPPARQPSGAASRHRAGGRSRRGRPGSLVRRRRPRPRRIPHRLHRRRPRLPLAESLATPHQALRATAPATALVVTEAARTAAPAAAPRHRLRPRRLPHPRRRPSRPGLRTSRRSPTSPHGARSPTGMPERRSGASRRPRSSRVAGR